ncbi:MAG: threonine ammonia-lyase, biosynthetic [Rhodospirillaceae bacterium]|nr:threonine ammonia-lyase, biosynthetic [Rhodospirillaceae bacterium]MBT5665287.1 threonine ammonia-lyase, biosynthetic [Rhodospirillaceae bacterium]MBT5810137.1 threonine ammonia-lyase, biosynthetic [Rhodospirillaceae bacterium]
MTKKYLNKILNARVYDVARETPLDDANTLSQRLGNRILIKREDLQPVFSFKVRGAYNKLIGLSEADKKKGVIAASAGNHAQGVALSAQKLGVKATIVMPVTTPEIKVQSVAKWKPEIILHGDDFQETYSHAMGIAAKRHLTFVHPFDDPEVIAGQGTVGMEILRQHMGDIHAIFIPVGGGGLLAGIAAYVKAVRPEVKIIGVEPEDAASLYQSLKKKRRVTLKQVGIFADGVAVATVGKETFRIARQVVDDMVLASVDEICAAVKDIFEDTRSIAEPAGALALAGLKKYVAAHDLKDKTLIAINSGANINFDRLRHVSERAELGENRESLFAVTIPEKRGSFRNFCNILGKRSVTEFNYRYADEGAAQIFLGLRIGSGGKEHDLIMKTLTKNGYNAIDLSDNDTAKLHIRYMVGGRPPNIENEVIYRFQFPERPGALLNFLNHMGERWNISLFHYRNHGSAFGRVLCGMQVPEADTRKFQSFLDKLGYNYWPETGNPVYKTFLN